MNFKKLYYVFALTLIITGCDSGNVNFVKNGYMNGYDTLTIGQAFDGWSTCETTNWEAFETDRGEEIVSYSCQLKFSDRVKKVLSDVYRANLDEAGSIEKLNETTTRGLKVTSGYQAGATGDYELYNKLKDGARFRYETYLDGLTYNHLNYVVQFALSQKDDSFVIDYIGAELTFEDGSVIDKALNVNNDDLLEVIYNNYEFDFDTVKNLTDGIITNFAVYKE
ncbi:MAG: hypothetical protein ACON41_02985 [Parvibaculales bacterium]